MSDNEPSADIIQYPLLPLRDVVVFPHMVIPLFVGRPKSIKAMETAMEAGKSILLVAQKSAAKDDPDGAPTWMYVFDPSDSKATRSIIRGVFKRFEEAFGDVEGALGRR